MLTTVLCEFQLTVMDLWFATFALTGNITKDNAIVTRLKIIHMTQKWLKYLEFPSWRYEEIECFHLFFNSYTYMWLSRSSVEDYGEQWQTLVKWLVSPMNLPNAGLVAGWKFFQTSWMSSNGVILYSVTSYDRVSIKSTLINIITFSFGGGYWDLNSRPSPWSLIFWRVFWDRVLKIIYPGFELRCSWSLSSE
jgi:hypothetical protein